MQKNMHAETGFWMVGLSVLGKLDKKDRLPQRKASSQVLVLNCPCMFPATVCAGTRSMAVGGEGTWYPAEPNETSCACSPYSNVQSLLMSHVTLSEVSA